MIIVKSTGLAGAWRESLKELMKNGHETSELLKEDTLVIEIEKPNTKLFDELYPVDKKQIEIYREYIIRGGVAPERKVGTSSLYYCRLHDFEGVDQLEWVITALKTDKESKRAMISFWAPNLDNNLDNSVPCMQIIWFKIVKGKLEMHCHMRANDAYDKLLTNLNVAQALQEHVAHALNLRVGKYLHFVDSFHIYNEDENAVKELLSKLGE